MRAVRYHETGGPDVLQVDDVETPDPGPGEVRVAVHAAGVNPVDTYFRSGTYDPPTLPMVPGSDLAGVVDAVGEDVDAFAVGDRVFGTGLGNDRQGTYAEMAVAPADLLAHLPEGISFVEGAAVALVGTTAWQAVVHHGDLEPAQTALIHGGNGGVGHVAVQLAAAVGATVHATASEDYHDRLKRIGADAVFDYAREDLADAVERAGPPEYVLDQRVDEYLSLDVEVLEAGGRVVAIGNTGNELTFEGINTAKGKDLRVQWMSMFNTPDTGAVLDRLATLMAAGDVVPEVDRTYPLEAAADAQRAVLSESVFGKLVVEP
ncbi:MAG: NADPH:quinone reductase [Halobacteriaceae archaeon]